MRSVQLACFVIACLDNTLKFKTYSPGFCPKSPTHKVDWLKMEGRFALVVTQPLLFCYIFWYFVILSNCPLNIYVHIHGLVHSQPSPEKSLFMEQRVIKAETHSRQCERIRHSGMLSHKWVICIIPYLSLNEESPPHHTNRLFHLNGWSLIISTVWGHYRIFGMWKFSGRIHQQRRAWGLIAPPLASSWSLFPLTQDVWLRHETSASWSCCHAWCSHAVATTIDYSPADL